MNEARNAELKAMVEKHVSKYFETVFVAHDDHFSKQQVQWYLRQEWEALDESTDEWMNDCRWDSVCREMDEVLGKENLTTGDLTEEEQEYLRELIENKDTGHPYDDLLRHTPGLFFYYDLGREVESDTTPEMIVRWMGVKGKHPLYAKCLDVAETLIANASYGGSLVIIFHSRPRDLYSDAPKDKWIVFTNPHLCIMDRMNGSGHDERWPIHLALKFDPLLLNVDDVAPGYSYGTQVCGLAPEYYQDGSLQANAYLRRNPLVMKINAAENPTLKAKQEREARYDKTWDGGRGTCTAGDMNMSRHKKTVYVNEFPCGTHCVKCHTFWID